MPTDNSEIQFRHPEKKPFADLLVRAKKSDEKVSAATLFAFYFLGFVSMRAVWELHDAGRPVFRLVLWAAFMAAGLTLIPVVRARLESPRAKN